MSNSLWQAVLGEIELSVSRGNFITWFKNTTLLHQDEENITIGVPNVFIKQQLERKYNDLITDTLRKNGAEPIKIEYKIHSTPARSSSQSNLRTTEREETIILTPSTPATPTSQFATDRPRPQSNTLSHNYISTSPMNTASVVSVMAINISKHDILSSNYSLGLITPFSAEPPPLDFDCLLRQQRSGHRHVVRIPRFIGDIFKSDI